MDKNKDKKEIDYSAILTALEGGQNYSQIWEGVLDQKTNSIEENGKKTTLVVKQPNIVNPEVFIIKKKD